LAYAERLFSAHPRLALIAARTLVGAGNELDPLSAFMASAPLGQQADLPGPSVIGFLACAAVVRREAFSAAAVSTRWCCRSLGALGAGLRQLAPRLLRALWHRRKPCPQVEEMVTASIAAEQQITWYHSEGALA
jgi:hypothetical protein